MAEGCEKIDIDKAWPLRDLNLSYTTALHAMQSGVEYELSYALTKNEQNHAATPKQLRTGVNSALVSNAALVRLLVSKGLFTVAEYEEQLRLAMNEEVAKYEDAFRVGHGVEVKFR